MAARILNYNMFVDLTAHISQWKNVLYSFFFFIFITFPILFQKLCNAVESGDVDLVQDYLHKCADVHYKDGDVSSMHVYKTHSEIIKII
jgi:hypothetical protein